MIYIIGKNIGDFGGGAVVARDILDSLHSSGQNVTAVSMGYDISKEYSDKFLNIPYIKMPFPTDKKNYPDNLFGSIKFRLKQLEYQFRWLNLRFQFRKNPPKIMMLNDTFRGTRDVFGEYKKLSPSIQIIHVSPTFVKEYFGGYSLESCIKDFNRADVLLFVSDECRKEWIEQDALDEKRAYYIPNCANEAEAESYLGQSKESSRDKLKLNSNSFYMINVASIKERKGQGILIEAAPELKKIAPNLELLIIGSGGGKFVSELKDTIEKKELNFVHFLGHRSNAKEYIYASDLFVLPSRAEAFPLVILEAMILKTPVIGSNVDGVPEMVTHEQTGLLFESGNAGELVQRFEKMYRNSEARKKYAENASQRYWSDFSKEQFTKRYVSMIEELLEKD